MSKLDELLNQWIDDTNSWRWPEGFTRRQLHAYNDGKDDLRGAHRILCDLRTALDRQRAAKPRRKAKP